MAAARWAPALVAESAPETMFINVGAERARVMSRKMAGRIVGFFIFANPAGVRRGSWPTAQGWPAHPPGGPPAPVRPARAPEAWCCPGLPGHSRPGRRVTVTRRPGLLVYGRPRP